MKHPALVLIAALIVAVTLPACRREPEAKSVPNPIESAYGIEPDWNDPQRLVSFDYQQTQGQRLFYDYCVWCHADSTPAGPSNRSNLNPVPALANDGTVLNPLSDEFMQNIITLGGSAVGKSAMMPAWAGTLTRDDIRAVVAYMRAIAQPPYRATARPSSQSSGK